MSNYIPLKMIITVICLVGMFVLPSCARNIELSRDTPDLDRDERCAPGIECVVHGELVRKRTPQGDFFEIVRPERGEMCVGFENQSIANRVGPSQSLNVSLKGLMVKRSEAPDCAFLRYGETNIPCGYCLGESIFIANELNIAPNGR